MSPDISVVIATYNRPEKLAECLERLRKQTLPFNNFEVIIVNNGSSLSYFETEEKFMRQRHFRFINSTKNLGAAEGRNRGVKMAKGKIVAFTDDDCLVPRDWLEKLLKGFKDFNAQGVGGYITIDPKILKCSAVAQWSNIEEKKYVRHFKPYISTSRDESPFQTSNIAYLKKAFLDVGGFDPSFPAFASGEDGDLKERILNKGYQVVFIPLPIIHNQEYTWSKFTSQQKSRGAGILYYLFSRNKKIQPRLSIIARLLLTPLVWMVNITKNGLKVGTIATVAYFYRNQGKLIFYQKITAHN